MMIKAGTANLSSTILTDLIPFFNIATGILRKRETADEMYFNYINDIYSNYIKTLHTLKHDFPISKLDRNVPN